MNATNTRTTNTRTLKPGTLVINTSDGESGEVVRICTRRRNGTAWSYIVATSSGREVWEAGEILVPDKE